MAALTGTILVCALGLLALAGQARGAEVTPVPYDRQPVSVQDGRVVSGDEMARLQNWGRLQGESWLRESLGLDVSRWQLSWDPNTWDVSFRRPPPQASTPGLNLPGGRPGAVPGASGRWDLRLSETRDLGDLMRSARAMEELPFSMELSGQLPVLNQINTRMVVPLAQQDEWRAEASLPVHLGFAEGSWWRSLGLGRKLSLRSDVRSRLGQNQWEAGLGTDWNSALLGSWALDVDMRKSFGMGNDEAVQWLKLSRGF